jgi:hypothetical protein
MTPNEWGRAAKALKDIRSVKPDLSIEDIRIASENYKQLYGISHLTVTALSNNWSKIRPGVVLPDPKKSSTRPAWAIRKDKEAEIDALEEKMLIHPGNANGRKCIPHETSEATFAAFDQLKAKLKALQAELASIPA